MDAILAAAFGGNILSGGKFSLMGECRASRHQYGTDHRHDLRRHRYLRRLRDSPCLHGCGGFLFCLNSCAGFVEQAKGLEMDAISSAVIGGTLLSGGVGTPFGTIFGVLIKGTISSLITTQGTLSSWWVRIVLSALLCFFIVLQSVLGNLKRRNKR